MIKILIVDDHPLVRQGLKLILGEEADMQVMGEASSAQEALALVRQGEWEVVLLDISMPERSGLDILSDLKRDYPSLPVLILSVHREDLYAIRALRAGAAGYLQKACPPTELVTAVRKVQAGEKYVSVAFAEQLATAMAIPFNGLPHEALSNREYTVFRLLSKGKTVSEIAQQLMLSVKTISTYRTRILEKMHLRHNAEIMRYAVQHGLVE